VQIRIKTAEEFHAGHVTIEIQADQGEVAEIHQRLFSSSIRVQSSEAELVAAPLRARIEELERQARKRRASYGHVCTDSCKPNSHVAFIGREQLTELEREVAGYREVIKTLQDEATSLKADRDSWKHKAEGWDHDRHTERDRADQFKAELRRALEELRRRFTTAQVEDAKAAACADARALEGARIRNDIRAIVNPPESMALAEVLRQVREYLDK
jgi:chromosome segregation ATPase